jgi:hypothetical protein
MSIESRWCFEGGGYTFLSMAAIVIGVAAVLLLIVEMSQPPARGPIPTPQRIIHSIPFVAVSALSLWVAGRAPQGRKPFQVDLSLSADDLALSMTKVPHLRSMAIIFLLAALAVGSRRLASAFALTMLVGLGWELAEATVVGHHARLADLAPDLVAAVSALAMILGLRWVVTSRVKRRSAHPTADAAQV